MHFKFDNKVRPNRVLVKEDRGGKHEPSYYLVAQQLVAQQLVAQQLVAQQLVAQQTVYLQ